MPPTVQSLLAAVAELPEAELKAALSALRRAEFIHEQALYPVAEYAFKHPLTQEVALGSQLQKRRRRTHAALARALEGEETSPLDENAALLAYTITSPASGCSRKPSVVAQPSLLNSAITSCWIIASIKCGPFVFIAVSNCV